MTQSRLRLVARYPHYYEHLEPVWAKMPEAVKGDVILGENHRLWTQDRADVFTVNLVAGHADIESAPNFPYIYVEHGAGQAYHLKHLGPHYSGSRGHNACLGFICPNSEVAGRWLRTYPDKPSAVVGCPRLDPWHAGDRGEPEDRTVAITFHFDAQFTGVPETASTFGWWFAHGLEDALYRWRRAGWTVLGHWHPRYPQLQGFWEQMNRQYGVEVVPSAAEVLDRASILVADNTSMQAEMLSLGRRVVWLNSPENYRKDVDQGGRFWTWPRMYGGTEVDDERGLRDLVLDDVAPTLGHPYAFADGRAASRASLAIRQWLADAVS